MGCSMVSSSWLYFQLRDLLNVSKISSCCTRGWTYLTALGRASVLTIGIEGAFLPSASIPLAGLEQFFESAQQSFLLYTSSAIA